MGRAFTVLFIIVMVYGQVIFSIGFLSDDFTLMQRAEHYQFLAPLETHHYSLLINIIYFFVAKGSVLAAHIHFFALFFHFFNCLLLLYFLEKVIDLSRFQSTLIVLLFAISPAGFEALVWCCAIPYIAMTMTVLLSLIAYGLWLKKGSEKVRTVVFFLLPLLQLFSLFIWEWGVLILPLCLIFALFFSTSLSYQKRLKPLVLTLIVLLSFILIRKVYSLNLGYQINSLKQIITITFSSPFIGLFPILPKSFYSSFLGVFFACITCFLCFLSSFLDKKCRLFFVLFLVSQLPVAVLGHPQSRYFYLSEIFLYSMLVLSVCRLTMYARWVFIPLIAIYISIACFRVDFWKKASCIVESMQVDLTKILAKHRSKVVVLDLPDSYGSFEMIWRPYLWRCGLDIFGPNLLREHQPGYPTYRVLEVKEGYRFIQCEDERF